MSCVISFDVCGRFVDVVGKVDGAVGESLSGVVVDVSVVADVPALLGGGVAAEVDRPLLTYYDDATGERTELSAAALGAWASRTAGLLHEGCGLGVGGRVAVLLPPHWQTAAVL